MMLSERRLSERRPFRGWTVEEATRHEEERAHHHSAVPSPLLFDGTPHLFPPPSAAARVVYACTISFEHVNGRLPHDTQILHSGRCCEVSSWDYDGGLLKPTHLRLTQPSTVTRSFTFLFSSTPSLAFLMSWGYRHLPTYASHVRSPATHAAWASLLGPDVDSVASPAWQGADRGDRVS